MNVTKVTEPAKREAGIKVESAAELAAKLKEAGVISVSYTHLQGFNYETSNIVTRFLLASFRKIGDDKTYLTAETNLKTNNNSLIFVKVSTNGKIAFYTDCRKKSAISIVDKLGISRNNDTCTLSERSQYYELAYEISNTEPDVVLTPVKP